MTSTLWRARPSTSAALSPAGPPPTITTSYMGAKVVKRRASQKPREPSANERTRLSKEITATWQEALKHRDSLDLPWRASRYRLCRHWTPALTALVERHSDDRTAARTQADRAVGGHSV